MDPPEWEVEPIVEELELDVTLVAGLAPVIPALPPSRAAYPPRNPPIDAPRAMAGIGGECGAIMAWGAELRWGARIADIVALGARSDAGAPAPRESEVGADWGWTNDLEFAGPLTRAVDCADCFVSAPKLGAEARVACSITPSRATGRRAPALIAPLAPCVARIAVDGIAAS